MTNDKLRRTPISKRALVLIVAVLGFTFLVFTAANNSSLSSLEISATLVPSKVIRVTGVVHPFAEDQVSERHIVLCQWVGRPRHTYECKLTGYTTTTDEQGRFELKGVEPGEYLVIYDSGLADFKEGLNRWKDTTLHVGDLDWLSRNDFFGDEPDGGFLVCGGGINGWADFYILNVDLTLCGSGSPFAVAHDVEAALKYDYKRDGFTLPPGVFRPVVVKVLQGYSSHVEFSALSNKR